MYMSEKEAAEKRICYKLTKVDSIICYILKRFLTYGKKLMLYALMLMAPFGAIDELAEFCEARIAFAEWTASIGSNGSNGSNGWFSPF
nr:hypothetical protein [Tanacetum cinerariifolium]